MAFARRIAASLLATTAAVLLLSAIAVTIAVRLFGVTIPGAIALYFVIWWTLLFAVLPVGVRSQLEEGKVVAGTDPGAPAAPGLREKALLTTLASAAALVAIAGVLPLAGL